MSIEGIKAGFSPIPGIKSLTEQKELEGVQSGKDGGFADMFKKAIKEVDQMQFEADKQIEGLLTGNKEISPHGAMIALEKADIAFQLMTQVRSKIIRAYEEILRTQV